MKKTKGFTLIELLVVIAIIGILSAIVLVSLSGARNRAKDARIQADLNQIRSAAEIIYSSDDNYSGVVSNADISALVLDIQNQRGSATTVLRTATSTGSAYCVEAQLISGKWACVNSGLAAVFNCATATACAGTANTADASNTSCVCP